MQECFARLTPNWLQRAFVYTGSIGRPFHDFRYRLAQDAAERVIHAAAYSKCCYELAEDRLEKDFPWDEAGVEDLKRWLDEQYEAFMRREQSAGGA